MVDSKQKNKASTMFAKNLPKSDVILSRLREIRENSEMAKEDPVEDDQDTMEFKEDVLIKPWETKNVAMASYPGQESQPRERAE